MPVIEKKVTASSPSTASGPRACRDGFLKAVAHTGGLPLIHPNVSARGPTEATEGNREGEGKAQKIASTGYGFACAARAWRREVAKLKGCDWLPTIIVAFTILWLWLSAGGNTVSRDADARPATLQSTSGSTGRVFDELNRLTSCTDEQGYTVGYGYDNEGNVTTITYPGGKTVTYTYDGSNRLKTVTDWAGRVTTYTYDVAGRLETVARPNNVRQRVTLDNANELTGDYEELMSGGSVVATPWEATYSYYNNGLLESFVPTPIGMNYAPPSTSMTYDVDNQLSTYQGTSISHDGNGNLQSAPVNGTVPGALTWDARNRLTSAGGVTYTYDAENRRLTSTVAGQTTKYVFSRGAKLDELLEKINPDGSITRYIYGTGLLYEETTAASGAVTPLYYHYDWRGDTVALSDSNGNVTARMSYSPYGERTIVSGTVTTPFCFNGKWGVMREPNGLYCMQARYYSPILRRFLNEDPSGFSGGGNLYAYSGGDPVDLMDPFGLGPITSGAGTIDSSQSADSLQLEQGVYAAQNPQYAAVLDEANAGYMSTVPQDWAERAVRGIASVSEGLGIMALMALQPEDAVLGEGAEAVAGAARMGEVAADSAGSLPATLYHYTSDAGATSILQKGILPGASGKVFTTTAGDLSPVQAQIELALSPNRGLPGAMLEIDAAGLQKAGIKPIMGPLRVQPTVNAPGGGTEAIFDQQIPPQFIKRIW